MDTLEYWDGIEEESAFSRNVRMFKDSDSIVTDKYVQGGILAVTAFAGWVGYMAGTAILDELARPELQSDIGRIVTEFAKSNKPLAEQCSRIYGGFFGALSTYSGLMGLGFIEEKILDFKNRYFEERKLSKSEDL